MAQQKNPWEVLGILESASDDQIKKAFRVKARENHPDTNRDNPNATEIFQEITHAYESIRTADRRLAWISKQQNHSGFSAQEFTPHVSSTIYQEVEITFAQAYSGTELRISVEAKSACSNCQGRGCAICKNGSVKNTYQIRVKIPMGVENGQQLKVASKDLPEVVLTVNVQENKVFKRLDEPSNLLMTVPLNYSEAALGTTVNIPTPSKAVALKIPPGTPVGKTFRVPGHGFTVFGSDPTDPQLGDLYVRITVAIPSDLNSNQAKLLKQLSVYDKQDIREKLITDLTS